MMLRNTMIIVLALCLGCSSKKKEPSDSAAGGAAKQLTDTHAAQAKATELSEASKESEESAKRPEPPKVISKADARARLEEWLKAQNEGDFSLYQSQYARAFTGIKRVRERSSEFDRDAWLTDRKRMFRKPMVVEAADLRLSVDRKPATVEFVQTWSSGSFRDVGPKRLTLVREGDKLLISREEMLSSKVVDSRPVIAEIRSVDQRIGDLDGEEFEVGVPGMSGVARRYLVAGEIVKVWENISADHHDESITIYFKEGMPFYASWDLTTGEDVEWDEQGGTAGKSRYVFREFLLSKSAVTDAWERDKTFEGEYPSGALDELMATKPAKLSRAIGNSAYFDAFKALGDHLRRATSDDYNQYEALRGAFDELDP